MRNNILEQDRHNLYLGYRSVMSMMQWQLQSTMLWKHSMLLDPLVASLRNLGRQ
jgi:hypothetical protein